MRTMPIQKRIVTPRQHNWTRVRVWRPTWEPLKSQIEQPFQPPLIKNHELNRRTTKPFSFFAALVDGHVGHATVQTSKFYASVYPDSADKTAIRLGKPIDLGYVDTPEDDMNALEAPHLTIDYFCLNTDLMAKLFNDIKAGKTSYKAFQFTGSKGVNCSDLTFNLLEVGGFDDLLSYPDKIKLFPARFSFYTPNIIANTLKNAKKREIELFPQARKMQVIDKSTSTSPKPSI